MTKQVGGTHYGDDWGHWDWVCSISYEAALYYLIGVATKYVCRHRNKNGEEDLEKAITYVQKADEILFDDKTIASGGVVKLIDTYNLNLSEAKILFQMCAGEYKECIAALRRLIEEEYSVLVLPLLHREYEAAELAEPMEINTEQANDLTPPSEPVEDSTDVWRGFKGSPETLKAVRASGLLPWPFKDSAQKWSSDNSQMYFPECLMINNQKVWNGGVGSCALGVGVHGSAVSPVIVVQLDGWGWVADREHFITIRDELYVGHLIDTWGTMGRGRAAVREEGWTFTGDKYNQFIIVNDTVYGVGEGESWEKDVS